MKGIYWRPRKISRRALVVLTLVSIAGMAVLELAPRHNEASYKADKLAAAQLAADGMDLLKTERLERGHEIIPELDPAKTGLIGHSMSLVTSVPGHLGAKQTSANPNFAAAIVGMLKEAGVGKGDLVAVGCSGSFPAMNICVYSALETLGARPVVIASAAASQFGANIPDLMWVDMERELQTAGLISFRSVAASYGGFEDRGLGMSAAAKSLIADALARNKLPVLNADSLEAAIDRRMEIYDRESGGAAYKAYINIGGGATSVGRTEGKHQHKPGLTTAPETGALAIDSVMTRFAEDGVPLIHLVQINDLAREYGLPVCADVRPRPGTGGVFVAVSYDRVLAIMFLIGLIVVLCGLVLTGFRRPLFRVAELLHLHRRPQGPRLARISVDTHGGELMV